MPTFAPLDVIGTRTGPRYELDAPYGHIMALVVAATHRRDGVGGLLVQARVRMSRV